MNWLQRLFFRVRTGADIVNLGEVKDEVVIRYKGYYIHVLELEDELSLAWSDNPGMIQSVPVRDFWVAAPTRSGGKQ